MDAALETYLRGKEMQRPMRGAQRRIEGRIGQLLGPAKMGRPEENSRYAETFSDEQRNYFRLLARALANECTLTADECTLTADEWRKSRRALASLVRQRLGLNGGWKKCCWRATF